MRGRLLASSMITGAALLALGATAAYAADATSEVTATANSTVAISGAPTGQAISTITASADATADTSSTAVTEVVVTGSRIPQPNLTSISPIQSVTHQEFQLEGHTDVVDMLNNLPQEFQNNTSDFSNTSNPLSGPGGISTADLRGLGPQRTLVLVNGRRLGIGDADTGNNNPAPDLDQIPTAMIDHVEVLTGGASAAYGSDAMAGVINFVLKQDFEGIEVDGTLGADQHTQHNTEVDNAIRAAQSEGIAGPLAIPGNAFDGGNEDASVIFGVNAPDGKGNITAYFEFHNQEPVLMRNRDWSSCIFHAGDAPNSGFCTGSANSNLVIPLNGPGCPNSVGSTTCTVKGTSLEVFPQTGTSPPAYFNSDHYEYLSRADTRYVAGFEAHYDINKSVNVYSEFNFMSDHTVTEIAPSGMFIGGNPFDPSGSGGWQVNCNNPFLGTGVGGAPSEEQAALGCSSTDVANGTLEDALFGRRNFEGGPREQLYDHLNFRGVLGIRGDLGDAWHYDVYGSYYSTFLYNDNSNYLSNSRIQDALDVVDVGGVPTCVGAISGAAPGCVPYDIFQQGGVTQAALNYLNISGSESGTVEEQIVEGDFTGDLGKYGIKSPWANDGIGLSLGFDWRRDNLDFLPDAIINSGDLGGGSGTGTAINAGIGVWEGYFETRIPIVQDMPFAKLLSLEGGLRYSDYSSGPTPTTYKVGLQWSPVDDILFRGSYNRAIRAPSVVELFNPVSITQSNSFANGDPCAGHNPQFTLQQCENTGMLASQYGSTLQCPIVQCNVSAGGNEALKPETADTFTVGATFQPHWVRGLSFSVDWWDIMEYGFVGSIPPDAVLSSCADTDQAIFCDLIHRSPTTGALFGPSNIAAGGYIVGTGQNIAGGQEMGIDIQGNYRLDLEDLGAKGVGSLSFALNGSYMLKNSTILPGVGEYDCAGLFGSTCETINPRWRHTFRVTWNTPWNVLASLQWRYIGGASLDSNTTNPVLEGEAYDYFDAKLPAVNYLDLSGEWRATSYLTVRGGINNILDQDPPIINGEVSGSGTPNTYPTYDLLGRELFLSATMKF
jgi:iron complex outermembrane recepter protein